MVELVTQEYQETKPKSIKERLYEIISKYLFRPNLSNTRESIKNDVIIFIENLFYNDEVSNKIKYKYGMMKHLPLNIDIVFDEDNSSMEIVAIDENTIELFKDLELV